jgi:hypothetical protein
MESLQQLDYIAIGMYLSLMAGIGFFFKWFVKDIHSYTKGSGAIPWMLASISNCIFPLRWFVGCFTDGNSTIRNPDFVSLILFFLSLDHISHRECSSRIHFSKNKAKYHGMQCNNFGFIFESAPKSVF